MSQAADLPVPWVFISQDTSRLDGTGVEALLNGTIIPNMTQAIKRCYY